MKNTLFLLALTFCLLKPIAYVNAQEDVSELTLQKSFLKGSFETIKKFLVSANFIVLEIEASGIVGSGKITMTLLTPKGNVFKTYEIDDKSNVKYKQVFDLRKNPTEYVGDWQIKINVNSDATIPGSYEFNVKLN